MNIRHDIVFEVRSAGFCSWAPTARLTVEIHDHDNSGRESAVARAAAWVARHTGLEIIRALEGESRDI